MSDDDRDLEDDGGIVAGLSRSDLLQLAVVAVVIVSVIGPPAISAATSFFSASSGTHWQTDTGFTIEQASDTDYASGGPFGDASTFMHPGGNLSAPGPGRVTIQQMQGTRTTLTDLNVSETTLSADPVDKNNLSVTGEATSIEWKSVSLDDDTNDIWVTGPDGTQTTVQVENLPANQYVQVYRAGTIVAQTTVANDGTFAWTANGSGSTRGYSLRAGSVGSAPTLSNPSPTSVQKGDDLDSIEVDMDDPDFGNEQVRVYLFFEAPSGNYTIYNATFGSARRVKVAMPSLQAGKTYTYTWWASDDEGNTVNLQRSFTVPDTQTIRDQNGTIIKNVEVRIRYYQPPPGETVVERSTTSGNISIAGLNVTEDWVAIARADGYYKRKILVDGLVKQPTLFLLDENVPAVYQRFVLLDKTGQFDDNGTRLIIERALNYSETNGPEWFVVAGDYFGADGQFRIYLEKGQRYRLTLINEDGLTKTLGNYMAEDEVNPKTIEVGEIGIIVPDEEPYLHRSWIEETDDNQTDALHISYSDPAERTETYCVRVHERGQPETPIYEQCPGRTLGNFSVTLKVNQSKSWAVNWTAERTSPETNSTEEIGGTRPLGGDFAIDIPLGPPWLFGLAFLTVAMIPALADKRNAGFVSIGAVAVAGIFIYVTWLPILAPFWVIAMVVAVGITMRRRQRGLY